MKRSINLIYYYLFIILFLELIYRIFVLNNIFSIDTFIVLLFSIPITLFLSIISRIFKPRTNKIITTLISIIILFIFLIQIVYFNFYSTIGSVFSLFAGTKQLADFLPRIITVTLNVWYIILISFIPIIIFIIFKNKINFNKLNKKYLLINISVYLYSLAAILFLIGIDTRYTSSLNYLLTKTHAPILSVNKVGLLTTEIFDINRMIFGFTPKPRYDKYTREIKDINYTEDHYNIIDIDFKGILTNEKKDDIIDMNLYFWKEEPTNKNEYTSMFKDKNLIFITAESFDTIAIDENITPTLYKISKNGFIFNNFYQPLYPVSTTDGEFMNLTSLIPEEGTWSNIESSDISMPYALGNVFKRIGYKTHAYHNHDFNFYKRQLSHTNYGFKYEACGNGLETKMNCNLWPNSDLDMIKSTIDDYINEDKFLAYYMTVSGHLDYDIKTNDMVRKNYGQVKDLKKSEVIKSYYATQIELDKSLKYLINKLKEKNKLNDTLIVIVPDHYPYGLTKNEINSMSNVKRNDKLEINRNTLIIYNPLIKDTVINKHASSIDILPTIYNLFGVKYDSRLLMGKDIFSETEGLIIFSNRSWITDKGKYDTIKKEFTPFESIDKDYSDRINEIVNLKFDISSLILSKDYYCKLGSIYDKNRKE